MGTCLDAIVAKAVLGGRGGQVDVLRTNCIFSLSIVSDPNASESGAPIVIAYHGTSVTAASVVLSSGFQLSSNEYDWLGDGVYFFQDARIRAWEWAQRFHDKQAAVLGARIRLEDCMDLLDIAWFRFLASAYDSFMAKWKSSGRPLPVQIGGAHRMDRHVINYAIGVLAERGLKIRTVRAAFSEGKPVFPNSALMDHSHVQIAVRDTTLIENVWSADDEKEITDVDA